MVCANQFCIYINVGTLEQNHVMPGMQVTYKAAELMQQFSEANLHIQESRARESGCKQHGPFKCLVAAGDQGQACVELWINEPAISDALGLDFQVDQDMGAWYTSARILAATCHIGSEAIAMIVAYAPQRGQGEKALEKWWQELRTVLQTCRPGQPCFLMGDLNCRVGSVESDLIDTVGADLEDFAGEKLRELCHEFRLFIPATMTDLHVGQTWTHLNAQGTGHRLDYIVVTETCRAGVLESWVDYDINVLNGDRDHHAVAVSVEMIISQGPKKGIKRMPQKATVHEAFEHAETDADV